MESAAHSLTVLAKMQSAERGLRLLEAGLDRVGYM